MRIISAKYGIISKDSPIEYYDERLTPEKATDYRKRYSSEIRTLRSAYKDILIYGSDIYQSVFKNVEINRTEGRIGEQLSQLKKWLYSER